MVIDGLLDQTTGEALLTALAAYDRPDPQGATPPRTPAQRRADAFGRIIDAALSHPQAPHVEGQPPRVLATVDLRWLAGTDRPPLRTPALRFTGPVDDRHLLRLLEDAEVSPVATLGPWRPVAVGRRLRRLPAWLRPVIGAVQRTCRGPGCDRPAAWADQHHVEAWQLGGATDPDDTVPLCRAHHTLVTRGRWQLDYDPDTAICTWTSRDGVIIRTRPPPP